LSGPHELRRDQWVPRPRDEVFAFFSDARNLEFLTPQWLRFQILTSPAQIAPGARMTYRLQWHGIPIHWTTEIVLWQPPEEFEDVQLSGPYKRWRHTHRFEADGGGTRMTDVVEYELRLGWLGRVVHALTVRRNLERIFDYRYEQIRQRFGGRARGPA